MKKQWDAEDYRNSFGFVPNYGRAVLDLLELKAGQKILDLGCGNGSLTKRLSEMGAAVTGADSSAEMVALARRDYPELDFVLADAEKLCFHEMFDAVFSNAVFHWISDQGAMLCGVAEALRPGGVLVCEFGGKGCGKKVHSVLSAAFEKRGRAYHMPFYFPSIGEYAPLLEKHGLTVDYAALFDRPTKVEGAEGLKNWLGMFVTQPFEGILEKEKQEILQEAEDCLRAGLFDGTDWWIDYVRIRFRAVKR